MPLTSREILRVSLSKEDPDKAGNDPVSWLCFRFDCLVGVLCLTQNIDIKSLGSPLFSSCSSVREGSLNSSNRRSGIYEPAIRTPSAAASGPRELA